MRELTACKGKNSPRASCWSASFQLEPPLENSPPVKARMSQEHQYSQLHSTSSHHERTYSLPRQEHQDSQLHFSSTHHERTHLLSRQECHKSIKTVSFIPATATIRELTACQGKNSQRASQLHSSSSHNQRIYLLSRQDSHKSIKTVRFIPAPASMRELTSCQGKNTTAASRHSASFQLQPL
jgi:hypothetical protein